MIKLKCIGGHFHGKFKEVSFRQGDMTRFPIEEKTPVNIIPDPEEKSIVVKYEHYIIDEIKYYDEKHGWYAARFLRHADLLPGQAFELAFK